MMSWKAHLRGHPDARPERRNAAGADDSGGAGRRRGGHPVPGPSPSGATPSSGPSTPSAAFSFRMVCLACLHQLAENMAQSVQLFPAIQIEFTTVAISSTSCMHIASTPLVTVSAWSTEKSEQQWCSSRAPAKVGIGNLANTPELRLPMPSSAGAPCSPNPSETSTNL